MTRRLLHNRWVRWANLLLFLLTVNALIDQLGKLPNPWGWTLLLGLLVAVFAAALRADMQRRGPGETVAQAMRRIWTRTGLALLALLPILAIPIVVLWVVKGPPTFAWR